MQVKIDSFHCQCYIEKDHYCHDWTHSQQRAALWVECCKAAQSVEFNVLRNFCWLAQHVFLRLSLLSGRDTQGLLLSRMWPAGHHLNRSAVESRGKYCLANVAGRIISIDNDIFPYISQKPAGLQQRAHWNLLNSINVGESKRWEDSTKNK